MHIRWHGCREEELQDLQETQDTWEICTSLEPRAEARQTLQSVLNTTKDTCEQQNNISDFL